MSEIVYVRIKRFEAIFKLKMNKQPDLKERNSPDRLTWPLS